MKHLITKKQIILSCLFNGSNTIIWLYFFITTLNPKTFLYLTSLSGDLNSIYLYLCLTCDISNYFFKSSKLNSLNNFIRNYFSHVINPISYFVTFLFWGLFLMGGMDEMNNLYDIFFNIYEHIFITIFIILDILIADHTKHIFSGIILGFIYIYLVFYGLLCGFSTFILDYPPYPFLQKIKKYILFIYCIIFIIIMFFCYYLHILIYKIKDKFVNRTSVLVNESIESNTTSSKI